MAIKELFYDNRPQVLLNPRASHRIDPRFKFTRNGSATFVNKQGLIELAPAGTPRFTYDPESLAYEGLLLESSKTNSYTHSSNFGGSVWVKGLATVQTVTAVTPDGANTVSKLAPNAGVQGALSRTLPSLASGQTWTASLFLKKSDPGWDYVFLWIDNGQGFGDTVEVNLSNGSARKTRDGAFFINFSRSVQPYINGWYRVAMTFTLSSISSFQIRVYPSDAPHTDGQYGTQPPVNPDGNKGCFIWGAQAEQNNAASSYISTAGSAVTRAADLLSIEAPFPASGSVYIDARAITAAQNDTLLSLKNSSNDKIDLAYLSNASTYNSLALIANYDGTSKTSLPLPVPTTARERNIITWGSQNYQYGRNSSRFATSLSSSVPTGLNKLSIGHDAVNPAKGFNGYINTVYAWSGELTPAVAEALVRNDLDPINADTYSPTGPAGALALVINTQGASADGDKTFTLPAESAANDNDIVITWGDGTESGLDGADAEVGASGLTHTYPAAGIYPVWVEGQMQNIYYNNIANAADLLQIAAWGTGDMFTAPSTMQNAFYGCTQMDFSNSARTTNLPDTSAVQNWSQAFYNCSSITGTFPPFNFSAATNFYRAWSGCSGLTTFTAAADQTQNVTNFQETWLGCNSLTSFPSINTAAGTTFSAAWENCSSLTIFPLINTAAGTNFAFAWRNCSSLTDFPLINTSAGTTFNRAWEACSSLTGFSLINTAAGTNFSFAWSGCSSLTDFPLINTAAGTNFVFAWNSCSSLTSFPSINTAAGTNFSSAWNNCAGLTAFPALDFDAATGLASDASNTYTGFRQAWSSCDNLADFPANLFNNTTCTRYLDAFTGCALTAASIQNILVSINAAGTSNGNLGIGSGTNAAKSTWTSAANTAYDALVARGWTITYNA